MRVLPSCASRKVHRNAQFTNGNNQDVIVDLRTNQVVETMLTLHAEADQFGGPRRIERPEVVHRY